MTRQQAAFERLLIMDTTNTPLHTPATEATTLTALLAQLQEIAAMTAVAWLGWQSAWGLSAPTLVTGLGQRYIHGLGTKQDSPALNAQAIALASNMGEIIVLLAAWAWVSLVLARRGRRGAGALIAALAALSAWAVHAFSIPDAIWLTFTLLATLLGAARNIYGSPSHNTASGAPPNFAAAGVLPLILLCAAVVGMVVLCDFGARGPLKAGYMGLHHLHHVWLALVVVFYACLMASPLLSATARTAIALRIHAKAPWKLMGMMLIGLVVAATLAYIGRKTNAHGLGMPQLSGEWSRWPLLLALAWFGYRRMDWALPAFAASLGSAPSAWQTLRMRLSRHMTDIGPALLGCVLAGLIGAGTWLGSDDFGPAMVMALSVTFMVVAMLVIPTTSRSLSTLPHAPLRRWPARLSAIVLVASIATGWTWAITEWLPLHLARAAERNIMREDPGHAASDQGALVTWLLSATPISGFGAGRTPWCGAKAHIGMEPCTETGQGVGVAVADDYPVALLIALWGEQRASLIVTALALLWLLALSAAWQQAAQGGARCTLRAWVAAAFAVPALVQTALVTSANLGHLPLSGLGLPFIGNGTHAMVSAALWLGLASAPLCPTQSPVVTHRPTA